MSLLTITVSGPVAPMSWEDIFLAVLLLSEYSNVSGLDCSWFSYLKIIFMSMIFFSLCYSESSRDPWRQVLAPFSCQTKWVFWSFCHQCSCGAPLRQWGDMVAVDSKGTGSQVGKWQCKTPHSDLPALLKQVPVHQCGRKAPELWRFRTKPTHEPNPSVFYWCAKKKPAVTQRDT